MSYIGIHPNQWAAGNGVSIAKAACAQQNTENCTAAPVDPRRLSSMLSMLQAAIEDVARQRSRLGKAMDYVLGVEPEQGCADKCSPPGAPFVQEMEDKFRTLCELLQGVNYQIDRLERVVG